MTREELIANIRRKGSFLCVGLDPDLKKIPKHLLDLNNPILEFNKAIIDATAENTVAYKLNLAFFENLGPRGLQIFADTINHIPDDIFVIADAKRGDIGNTATMYADAFFNKFNADAITVAPYMGHDSIQPFLEFPQKWTIVLGLTSNPGSADFQLVEDINGQPLWERVITESAKLGSADNMMFVIGATRIEHLKKVRSIVPNHFLLVPGIGAQGGTISDIRDLITEDIGVLVNSSRGIIYKDQGEQFANIAGKEAAALAAEMKSFIS